MKKYVASLLSAGLVSALLLMPVSAESSKVADQRGDNRTGNYTTNAVNDDNDFDWGWLGLLGLIGLAGLRSKDRERS
ncbi:hypothetical protein DCC85_07580 [Paenibacillus sp. CAA11]|uniref:WGxxGxxG family protein n=1 Tax=Paenibacillus sp. CAA11 TaxID=1532905 RepID=UPI000D356F7D|nr:WGxxGxxG family protein [Paenibacillus sp. CAA11]AWB44092.1 hypothetical protein DCC85_07580 [Paenibacillus sp. CAA11]